MTISCVFCQLAKEAIVLENELAFAFYDKFPVQKGHLLIVPKRHVETYFDATDEEIAAIHRLVRQGKERLDREHQPDGYNIGVNIGHYGGQTVMHLHFHLIPRYNGDIEDPRGGIRKAVPNLVPYPPEKGEDTHT
ncbi:diadenosine tetraphosphate (Ap4A) HIT family hydrolase [Aneurinibacillus soli]|uniref:AP-4-A phosphorylase n=1 Tax=Aneurinibacillus soli TaxID=1500254 RepID=A0A0U5AXF4_9BACL|nr:HIT family protein [Aneurinibacillus soli]PYE61725.1 diadenosine tetraphosphate (Ap4A) HIT family hydrolase [Aneurinibacillus soli]BAU28417.1 AP-4-A phosphorylase [Aneurinibacillus soli]